MQRWILCWMLVCSVVLVGCGDGLTRLSVEGKLLNQGKPLDSCIVQFLPGEGTPGEGAIGMSDAEGKFSVVSSRKDDSGIPAGKYRVRLSRLVNPDGTPLPANAVEAEYPNAKESIPAPYNTDKSPIEVTVDKGGALQIELPVKLKIAKK